MRSYPFVDGQERTAEHLAAVGSVIPAGQFLGGVADAADGGDEDHSHRGDPGDHLRVVAGPGGETQRLESGFTASFAMASLIHGVAGAGGCVLVGVMAIRVPLEAAISSARLRMR